MTRLQTAAKAGDLSAAEAAMQKLLEMGVQPNVISYGVLIGAHAKAGNLLGAEHWLEALEKTDLGSPNAICMNIVISACAKHGDIQRAESWLHKMPRMGVEPDVMSYNAVIDACARSGDIERAEGWLRKMCR